MKEALKALLFLDSGFWIIQLLEYNICAQGSSISEVTDRFIKSYCGHAMLNIHHGKGPMADVPVSPKKYFERWDNGYSIGPDIKIDVATIKETFMLRLCDKLPPVAAREVSGNNGLVEEWDGECA